MTADLLDRDAYVAHRFRKISDWCGSHGYSAGWPNFHYATYQNPLRTLYGHYLLRDQVVDWADVSAHEYNAHDLRTRFTGAHDYATRNGYQHGFPNFHEANYGQGVVYGTFLIAPGTCEWSDVLTSALGLGNQDPTRSPMYRWFRGAADYAYRAGFGAGMPNGHYARRNDGWVCGVLLFPHTKVDWADIPGREVGAWEQPPPPPPTPPSPPSPPEPDVLRNILLQLDYDPRRITRIGRTDVFNSDAVITKVFNNTDYTIELAAHKSNVVLAKDTILAHDQTNFFEGLHPSQNWVGTVVQGRNPEHAIGPLVVEYRA